MTYQLQATIAVAVVLFALPAVAAPQQGDVAPPVVVTSGEAVVRSAPDRAFVTVTTEVRASSPRDAQRQAADRSRAVQDALRSLGTPDRAIRSVAYNLQQEFDFPDGRRVSRGYMASNVVEVRVDSLDGLGGLLEAVVTSGATAVSDIRFDLKDREALEREAVRQAVENARARADAVARGAGATVGRILRIEEHGTQAPPPMPMFAMAAREQAQAADVPIAAGELELRARVTLTVTLD